MAARRGRQPGFVMGDEHRTKIANSQILKCLIEHATGQREMSATQVTAGVALMRKVLPDLAAVEHSGEIEQSYIARLPEPVKDLEEWQQRYTPQLQ